MNFFIEKAWWYRNFQCSIVFTDLGYRCGYIAVPHGMRTLEPENKDYPYADMYVHGGVTFDKVRTFSMGIRCRERGMQISDGVHIIGFDCAHYMDGFDADLTERRFGKRTIMIEIEEYVIRSQVYCEKECRGLVDQVIDFNKGEG